MKVSLVHLKELSPQAMRLLYRGSLLLGLVAIFWVCTFKVMDRDFWWHITAGDILLKTHHMITVDPFAFTRAGQPYLATHEWLAQIVLSIVYGATGATGIILLRGIIASSIAGFLLLIPQKKHVLQIVLMLWAIVITKGSYLERPQLFTYLIFAAFLLLGFRFLETETARQRRNICITLIVLQLLWVNMHGGAALLGCGVVSLLLLQMAARAVNPYTRNTVLPVVRLLAGTLALLTVTLVLPPNGLGTLSYLSGLMSDQTIQFIAEWQPRGWLLYATDLWPFWLLAVFSLAVGRRNLLWNTLLLAMTAYLSRQAIRHEILFVLAAVATTFYQLDRCEFGTRVRAWMQRRWLAAGGITLIVTVLLARAAYSRSFAFERQDNLFGFGQFDLARGAVDFIKREHITGNMFNTYGIGGYLIHRGYPDRKVFIDGRNVDYGLDFMTRTYAAGIDQSRWKELEDRYSLTYAIIDYDAIRQKDRLPYSSLLDKNPDWTVVYIDDWVAVYLKNTPDNQPIIDQRRLTLVSPTALQFHDDFEQVADKDLPQLVQELQRIRQDNPDGVKASLSLAKIALRQGRKDYATILATDVLNRRPSMPEPLALLASAYVSKQQWKDAADAYVRLLALAGDNYPDLNYGFISSVFEKAGYTWRAWYYRPASSKPPLSPETGTGSEEPALSVNPAQDAVMFNDRGIEEAENADLAAAEESFLTAIKLNPSFSAAWNNLCALYLNKNNTAKAEEACKRATESDPSSADAHLNLALVFYRSNLLKDSEKEALLAKKLGRTAEADQLLLLIRRKEL